MEFVVMEGTVGGARYFTVKPTSYWWPISQNPSWDDINRWCILSFGPNKSMWDAPPLARWYANNSKFWFRNEEDLAAFLLKWA